jgi:hypothetical protein
VNAISLPHRDLSGHGYKQGKLVLAAFVFFLLLSLLMTYPLTLRLNSAIPGSPPGDNFEYLWKVWWFNNALVEKHVSPFFAPQVFYPDGFYLANAEMTPANALLAIPLTAAFGYTASYNLMILLSFVLAGFGMYLFVRYLTKSFSAGLLSGVIFAFSPYHTAHALKHLPLVSVQWIPLLFLFFEKTLAEKRLRHAWLAGLFYSLAALSSWYYAVSVGLMFMLYALFRLKSRRKFFNVQSLKYAGVFLLVVIVLLTPFVPPYLQFRGKGIMEYPLREVDQYSANVDDFLIPSPYHPVWGQYVLKRLSLLKEDWTENLLYLGFVPLLLSLFAFVKRREERKIGLGLVAIASFVLALGTTLHVLGKRVFLGRFPLPLPVLGLFLVFPVFGSMRVWSRFGVMTVFAVAALAGFGLIELQKQLKNGKSSFVSVSLVALVLFDFLAVPFPMSKVEPRPVDLWLKKQKGQFNIIQLPPDFAGLQMYYSIVHGKRIAVGTGTFLTPEYNIDRYNLKEFPDEASIGVLKKKKIRFVLIDVDYSRADWPRIRETLLKRNDFRLVTTIEGIAVFEITDESPRKGESG